MTEDIGRRVTFVRGVYRWPHWDYGFTCDLTDYKTHVYVGRACVDGVDAHCVLYPRRGSVHFVYEVTLEAK